MLDKMFGVSPPLKGEALDSKLAHGKEFRGTSQSEYKRDFERALEKKLDQKREDLESKREESRKTEEFKADRKEKEKSLGGTKKKVTEDDDKMVSNVMASKESKVEIPDSKIENPATIETDITQKNKVDSDAEVKAAGAVQSGLPVQLAEAPKLVSTETTKISAVETSALLKQLSEAAKPEESVIADQVQLPGVNPEQIDLPVQAEAQLQTQPQMSQAMAQSKAQEAEAELSAAVGFKPDQEMQETNKGLLQKMKAFDVDKNSTSNKSDIFEQNVLSRLQNEQLKNANQVSEKSNSDANAGDSGQQGSEHLRDFKSDLLNGNQLHQATGQTHSEFSPHLGAATSGTEHSLTARLEEHREANINEIMSKAQYLVTKGGGEVSVKMSPEGLGDLHLKVMFQDGKLNIEMQTQNKDIKKLVEDSISELKSGLAAHRLSLEHVKIDTVSATNADNNTQFQSNLNQGGSQENAREVWNDFQGSMNNQSERKSSHSDSLNQPSVSSRNSSANAAVAANALRTYGGTKGATVNRVA